MNQRTDFDLLPKRERMSAGHDGWDRRGGYQKIRGVWVWDTIQNVIDKYLNKSFDDAFSYFCTLVPKYLQDYFLDDVGLGRFRYFSFYKVVNGIIKEDYIKKVYPIYFYSIDYDYVWEYFKNGIEIDSRKYNYTTDERKKVIISGYAIRFSSRNDYRYKKLQSEKTDQLRKQHREWKLAQKEIVYNFLTDKELAIKSNKHDIITRDRLGFDSNSFKGKEYHGRKNKKH